MSALREIAEQLRECAIQWEREACLVGNVTAAHVVAVCDAALTPTGAERAGARQGGSIGPTDVPTPGVLMNTVECPTCGRVSFGSHTLPTGAERAGRVEAILAEREACAKVCESRAHSLMHDGPHMRIEQANEAKKCASAIRGRGDTWSLFPYSEAANDE